MLAIVRGARLDIRSPLLRTYVRVVAGVLGLLGVTGLLGLWDVWLPGSLLYLISSAVFAYLAFGRVEDVWVRYVVCGMGLLFLISATLLIGMYIFDPSDYYAGHNLTQGLIRAAFGVSSILVACRFWVTCFSTNMVDRSDGYHS